MVGTPFCGGSGNPTDVFTATLSHVNKIVVRSPFNPAGTDTVIIDEANGQLRSSSFPRNRPQIFLLTGSGNDTLVINGTNGPDSYEAVGGFVGGRVFMEGDLGVTMSSLGRLIIHGNGGGDRISGHANFPDGGTTVRMEIYGGAGQDTLTVGESGKDRVEGGTEQDFVFTANGKGGDFALGGDGPGNDFITGDAGDTAQGFETKTGGVGTLKLTSRKVKAGADKTGVVGMSWTHPKAWQSLGTVTERHTTARSRSARSRSARRRTKSARRARSCCSRTRPRSPRRARPSGRSLRSARSPRSRPRRCGSTSRRPTATARRSARSTPGSS